MQHNTIMVWARRWARLAFFLELWISSLPSTLTHIVDHICLCLYQSNSYFGKPFFSSFVPSPRKCAQCPMFIVHWPAKGSRSTWIWPIWSYSRNPPFPSTVLVVLVLVVTSLLCLNLTDCPTQLLYWDFHLICPMTKLKEHSREINHASITFSNMSLAFS